MISALFFAVLVGGVFGAEIPCNYILTDNIYTCDLLGATISVTAQNEPITVTGTHIPSNTDDNVEKVSFFQPNVLNFVPTKLFEIFKNLREIDFSYASLNKISTNAFINCLRLEKLTFTVNNFTELPASFAEACVNLVELTFYSNSLRLIHKDAFKGLANLRSLYLSTEKFESLDPSTFVHTPKLENLDIENGNFKRIHPNLFAPLSLQYVSLYGNKIESLPALRFKDVSKLRKFYALNNQINEIDPELLKRFPADRESFDFNFNDNKCTKIVLNPKDQLAALKPCFDNWKKSRSSTTGKPTVRSTSAPTTRRRST
jgi:Leucine-rich repeat (LRR) protein